MCMVCVNVCVYVPVLIAKSRRNIGYLWIKMVFYFAMQRKEKHWLRRTYMVCVFFFFFNSTNIIFCLSYPHSLWIRGFLFFLIQGHIQRREKWARDSIICDAFVLFSALPYHNRISHTYLTCSISRKNLFLCVQFFGQHQSNNMERRKCTQFLCI